jgi:hypothetical protein
MFRMALTAALLLTTATSVFAADVDPSPEGLITAGDFWVAGGLRSYSSTQRPANGASLLTGAIGGSLSIPLASNISMQIDARHDFYSDDAPSGYQSLGADAFAAHLSWRDPKSYLLGVFGGVSGSNTGIHGQKWGLMGGAEAQVYIDNVTLFGQLGYADLQLDNSLDSGFRGLFGNVGARYFLNDDAMVQAQVGYGRSPDFYEDLGDGGGTISNVGALAKVRLFDSMPLYGFAEYNYSHYEANTEDSASEHIGLLGLSYAFGANNLIQNDRYGATLSAPMLPGRAANWGESLD